MLFFAVIGIVFIALYLYAGHRTWVHMMLVDDDPSCPISRQHADGTLPPWVYHLFLVIWGPLMIAVAVADRFQPKTYP